jgi:hypothetical protein
MSTFPETLGLGQVISRELKEEIERRYNTYMELEQQLAALKAQLEQTRDWFEVQAKIVSQAVPGRLGI